MSFDLNEYVKLGSQKNFEELKKQLDFYEKTFDQNAEKIFGQIQQLDLKTNSMLFCYTIAGIKINQNSFQIYDKFLKNIDGDQICLCMKRLCKLVENYLEFLSANRLEIKAMRALQVALHALNQAQTGLTPLHIWFLQICINTRFYKQAIPIIRQPIVNIDKKQEVDAVDLYIYLYYSGEIMAACKHFKEATLLFDEAFSLQTKQMHEVHIEAKKKSILLNLRKGKFIMKKNEEERVTSHFRHNENKIVELSCDTYMSMSNLKYIDSLDSFDQYTAQNIDTFQDDGNLGLVNQCRYAIVYYYLKQIKKIYLKFNINELWEKIKVNPQQLSLENILFEINKIKPIFSIDQKQNCIEFKQKDEIIHEEKILNPLAHALNLLKGVHEEFEKENQLNIKDRLKNPTTTFC